MVVISGVSRSRKYLQMWRFRDNFNFFCLLNVFVLPVMDLKDVNTKG